MAEKAESKDENEEEKEAYQDEQGVEESVQKEEAAEESGLWPPSAEVGNIHTNNFIL